MATVQGECQDRFEPLRVQLDAALADGSEAGLSVCAIADGEVLVDLWGGVADVDSGTTWERDTVVNVFSVTKTMTALAALLLVERSELDLDAPVAKYWPEFAAGGKDVVLVRHLLGHTSGVAGWQRRVSLADVYDTCAAADLLAAQEPWWEPGTASGYHAMNQGHLVGELVRRLTGQSLGVFFRAEIADPLDVDFHIGTPPAVDERVAVLITPGAPSALGSLPPESLTVRTLGNPVLDLAAVRGTTWRRAELGAMNGHGNARSVARAQSVISHGGRGLLGEATIARIFDVQADGVDQVLGTSVRFGTGYALGHPAFAAHAGRACWWTGFGGTLVVNDLDRRLTIAYVMNKMAPGVINVERGAAYVRAIYAALDGSR